MTTSLRPVLVRAAALTLALAAALLAPAASPAASGAAATSGTHTYLVLYKAAAVPADAGATIARAGGTLVASYAQIGVAVARSSAATFGDRMRADPQVDGASATDTFGSRLGDDTTTGDSTAAPAAVPAADADPLSPLQWDMRQIHTPQAHAITGGDPSVLVGDIDTGVDFNHPDLKPNLDVADSANCVSGAPVPGLAAQDDNGHGTHTAGTIAAAANGIGIVGVAPNTRIAAIKAGDAGGSFFPEAVVCAFMWAGTHHMQVTNNSYFADPWLYNCKNDPGQRAIWKAEQRAIRFAMQQGTTVVAAESNQAEDLAHPTQDATSPDNTTPETRTVHNDCVVIPVEIPGVVGVTADGNDVQDTSAGQYPDHLKSFYSSYGVSSTEVVAPGGDSVFGRTAEAPNGRVLSTWPPYIPCSRSVQEGTTDPTEPTAVYCYLQGTSMASPHVAGVAALIYSVLGADARPGQVSAILQQTADPQTCPQTLPAGYESFTGLDNGQTQSCTGGPGHTSWYGNGEVDAFNAVTHTP